MFALGQFWPSRPLSILEATIDKDMVMFDAAGIRERLITRLFRQNPSGHKE